jgi:hypothetical protein
MRILVLAFALLPAAALAADRDPPAGPVKTCKSEPQWAARPQPKAEPLRPQTLDKMPQAELYYPVVRFVDGCDKPVKVRDTRR